MRDPRWNIPRQAFTSEFDGHVFILGSANELTELSNVEFEDYARHDSTVALLLRLQHAEEKERAAEAPASMDDEAS